MGPNFDLESLTETLAEPERDPDGQPVGTFIPSVLGSKTDPVNPSGALMAWILLVTFAGLAGPVWAATRIGMNVEDDLVNQRFVACVALNIVFNLVPPFDIQRGKRKVTYSFGEVATLISIAIASAPVAIIAGFIALTIRSVQEYLGRPQERYRILFNYGLGSLGAWVTILVANSFHTAPWNYLVATFIGAIVVDCCLAQCFRIAFELPYRTYFARHWWSRLGIPAAVALATGTILMIPHAAVVLTAIPIVSIAFWWGARALLRVRSERANWVTLDLHNSALSGLALERDIARITVLNARVLFPMNECALFIYPTAVNKSGGYVVRLRHGQYTRTEPYEEGLARSYVPPQMGANAVVSAELAYAPLIAANKVLGHFELRFSSYQRRTGEAAVMLTHFLGKTSSSMMLARQNERLRVFAESKAREAEQDSLTGLGNRSRLHRGGKVALRHAREHGRQAALIIFDLDGFKRINDTLGHATGDEMLRVIAGRIKSAIGPHDIAARVGGDEFVIVAADLDTTDDAVEYAEMISRLIAGLVPVEGITLAVEASAGVAHVEGDANVAELMKRADIALYAAKDHGRGVIEVYRPELAQHSPEQLQLTADLRQCLERDLRQCQERKELVLHYQPQVNLADGKFMGIEALVRWQHPDRGLLYPDTFVPLAEHSGMIRPFTLLILDRALNEFSELRRVATSTADPALSRWVGEEFTLSVNFSARNLLDLELPEQVRERLAHYAVPAHRLVIEITESANVHDWASAEQVMKALSDLGCRVSIDDFGMGFSSLQSLVQRKDTVTEVKIDRSFIAALVSDSGSEFALVQAIVSMAHGTGCRAVAEGVELAESVPLLRAMGCDLAQGYFFARPMAMSAVLPWFEQWPQAWALVAAAGSADCAERLTGLALQGADADRVDHGIAVTGTVGDDGGQVRVAYQEPHGDTQLPGRGADAQHVLQGDGVPVGADLGCARQVA